MNPKLMNQAPEKVSKESGMAATEYILGLVLVAVASISVFTVFGGQIKQKIGLVAAAVSGDTKEYNEIQAAKTTNIAKRANGETTMKGGLTEELEFKPSN